MKYETVIGLEVHAQLNTSSKLFSGTSTTFGADANTQANIIDLAMPGTLPVLNQAVISKALKFGLSIDAAIAPQNIFARKNYFYPDLPKGYQISQFSHPIVGQGHLDILLADGSSKRIGITRAHLEEDAGKSMHADRKHSGIDLNRAGTPLLEIVSDPDIRNATEAITYLKTLHQLVRYLDICDGNMQEGSFRCDINISLRPWGQTTLGTRAELKNMNSFRFIENAIEYEIERQSTILDAGDTVKQETRQYDSNLDITKPLRAKEEAHDYRYFPDPDLLPVHISTELINTIKSTLPELPAAKCQRFVETIGLTAEDAIQITASKHCADYFEALLSHTPTTSPKTIANWINGEISAYLKTSNHTWRTFPIAAERLAILFDRINDQTISNNIGRQVFQLLCQTEYSVDDIIQREGLKQITDDHALESIIDEILTRNPEQVKQYQAGRDKVFGYFVGQVMKATKGKANPQQVNTLLKKMLSAD